MKQLVLMAACLILVAACKKENRQQPTDEGERKIRIDAFTLNQYDNVEVSATVEGIPGEEIRLRGFTWSLSPERTIGDSLYKIFQLEPFTAHLNSIGQNARIYMRAFVETSRETYFSDSIVINTSGLQLLWNREYSGLKRRVKQVIASGNDGFVLLVERMEGAASWPGLMKMDTSGNIIWDLDYYASNMKTPQYLQSVPDGYLVVTSQGFGSKEGILVFKTDLNGKKLWEQVFTKQGYEDFVRLTVLPDQRVQLTTRSYSVANGKRINVLIDDYVFDVSGQLIGTTSVPVATAFNSSLDPIRAVTTADGGFVSASETAALSAGVVVNKFSEANQVVWEQLCLRATAKVAEVSMNNAGNFMVRGSQLSNAVVMEIDKNSGELLWQYEFDVWKYDAAFGEGRLAVGSDGYYIAADSKMFLRPSVHGPLLVKLGMHGEFLYDYMHVVHGESANLHFTDAVFVNSNKEIYLFGTEMRQLSDREGRVFLVKLKER